MTIGLACSDGGHLTSMCELMEAFGERDIFLITYEGIRKPSGFHRVYYIRRMYNNPFKFIVGSLQILRVLICERPSMSISTGSEVAIPFMLFSKLLGSKTVYVESVARISVLSRAGLLLYGKVDYFLVQWPELLKKYGSKAEYRGRLL